MILWESAHAEPIAARIAIAGDFLPAGDLALPSGGWAAAARAIAPYFDDVSTSFMNLESAIDATNLPARPPAGLGQTVSAPSACLDYLRAIRCSPVGCANNHNFDFRALGAERTRAAIARAGMIPLGSVRTLRSDPDVFVWQGPGIRVGFWAAAIASRDLATRTTAGVEPATLARATEATKFLTARGAQISVALIHAGCLRTNRPDPAEADLMDSISRCGFNVVAASHSHRVSGARAVSARESSPSFCFYGLGSIASGYVASDVEREGLIVVAGLTPRGDLARVELRPVLLGASGFGEIPPPQASSAILARFRRLCGEIADGSSARLFYRDMSDGLVHLYLRDVRAALRQSGIRGLARKARRMRLRHVKRLMKAITP
jgi:hypothetical protein